jgi:hypothetical protein
MQRGLHELSEREKGQVHDSLALPVGEFAALIIGAVLTLAFFLGPPSLANTAKEVVRAAAAGVAGAASGLGDRLEARAAERAPPPARR